MDLFNDNALEGNFGYPPPTSISSYDVCISATHIKITYSAAYQDYVIIGIISKIEYINESNTLVSYIVDPFYSALETPDFLEKSSVRGLCERTHITYYSDKTFLNLQSEPFSPSDNQRYDKETSEMMNNFVSDFTGVIINENALYSQFTRIVITVSPAIIRYLNNPAPFDSPGIAFTQQLKTITNLNFYANDSTLHSGGTFRGTPLVFDNINTAKEFIKRILGGCGFITVLPANGYSTQSANTRRQYLTEENAGAGNVQVAARSTGVEEIESIRFITSTDIYNMYLLPINFCQNLGITQTSSNHVVDTMPTLDNFTNLSPENVDKSKLLSYPYCYKKLTTANGDTLNIIPQTHHLRVDKFDDEKKIRLDLKFIGGDMPKLMGRIPAFGGHAQTTLPSSANEWFTVINYPSITLSINDSYNPQIQQNLAQTRRISANYTNNVENSKMSNPIKYGLANTSDNTVNENSGAAGALGTNLGLAAIGLGPVAGVSSALEKGGFSLFKNENAQTAENENRAANAGNFISPDVTVINGNDFLSQYGVPPFSVFSCGATSVELNAFCRYIDTFGNALNDIINLYGGTDVLSGQAQLMQKDEFRFFKFTDIDFRGRLPQRWKSQIIEMFRNGVYLKNV